MVFSIDEFYANTTEPNKFMAVFEAKEGQTYNDFIYENFYLEDTSSFLDNAKAHTDWVKSNHNLLEIKNQDNVIVKKIRHNKKYRVEETGNHINHIHIDENKEFNFEEEVVFNDKEKKEVLKEKVLDFKKSDNEKFFDVPIA